MIHWPESLVNEIAERRCVFFLGAGASAASVSADGTQKVKDWKGLLEEALAMTPASEEERKEVLQLIASCQYLDAAQVIFDRLPTADRTVFFRRAFRYPKFRPSEIHVLVNEIDPKVVITTNYDEIYEDYCREGEAKEGYNVCRYYDDHALNDIRSDVRCILKAHGCVADPAKAVLTRQSYFEARRRYPAFYAILDSLFLINTVLFIGASLTDPDIQLVLENANISAPSVHPHYALVSKGRHASLVSTIRNTYNIVLLEYPAGQHEDAVQALRELRDLVAARRVERGIR